MMQRIAMHAGAINQVLYYTVAGPPLSYDKLTMSPQSTSYLHRRSKAQFYFYKYIK